MTCVLRSFVCLQTPPKLHPPRYSPEKAIERFCVTGRAACANLLGTAACPSAAVNLAAADDGTGNQRWQLQVQPELVLDLMLLMMNPAA